MVQMVVNPITSHRTENLEVEVEVSLPSLWLGRKRFLRHGAFLMNCRGLRNCKKVILIDAFTLL